MEFRKKSRNARAFIVLLAAMIAWLLNIRYDRKLLESLIILIIVIAVFYVIATIAIRLVEKILNMEKIQKVDVTDEDTENEAPSQEQHT